MKLEEIVQAADPNRTGNLDLALFHNYFDSYMDETGIDNVTKQDLDIIHQAWGFRITKVSDYLEIYKLKLAEDTNATMKCWTVAIGIMTFVIMVCTILVMFRTP